VKAKLGVPQEMTESAETFVAAESIPIDVGRAEGCTVQVVKAEERLECDASTLQTGGWITCAAAWAMARKLNISTMQMGKLLDFLDIKIRRCELGLFK